MAEVASVSIARLPWADGRNVTLPLYPAPLYSNVIYPEFAQSQGDIRVTATLDSGEGQQWINNGGPFGAWVVTGVGTVTIEIARDDGDGNFVPEVLVLKQHPAPSPDLTIKIMPTLKRDCRVIFKPTYAEQLKARDR